MPYIFVLFYQKIDPHIFVETVVNASPGTEFQWIHSFDRYYFGLDYCKDKDISAFVFENSAAQQFSPEEYSIKTFNGYSVAIRK